MASVQSYLLMRAARGARRLLALESLSPLRRLGRRLLGRWPFPAPVRLGGATLYVDLRSEIGRHLFLRGEFDPAVFEPIREALRPGDCFVDVGANVGYYSVLAALLVGPRGAVHAFEVDERPLRCLRKTIARKGSGNVVLHPVALGERAGRAALVQGVESGHTRVAPGGGGGAVEVAPLDDFLPRLGSVRALKIDVEGGELEVLRGAEALLARHRPVVVCEAVESHLRRNGHSVEDLRAFLERLGFRVEPLDGAWDPTLVARPPAAEAARGPGGSPR